LFRQDGDLFHKRVIVTGASLGIGREIALRFASAGVKHIALVARSQHRLETLKTEIIQEWKSHTSAVSQPTPMVHVLPADLSDEEQCAKVIETAVELMDQWDWNEHQVRESGGLDYLVLNHITNSHYGLWFDMKQRDGDTDITAVAVAVAAVSKPHPYVEEMFKVNTLSYIWLATAAVPYLQKRIPDDSTTQSTYAGHIVVISSLAGKTGVPHTALYSSTKHALHGFFTSLRIELNMMKVPVRVLLCVIGATNTEGTHEVQTKVSNSVTWEDPKLVANAIFTHSLFPHSTEMYFPHVDIGIASFIGQVFPSLMEIILSFAMNN